MFEAKKVKEDPSPIILLNSFLEILNRHGITPQKPISKIRRALLATKNLG